MRYQLLKQGPDNLSTYAECFGPRPASRGRLVAEGGRLSDLIEAADEESHHSNWCVYDSHRDEEMTPSEYFARPAIAKLRRSAHAD